jgi:hypothetical protein
VISPSLVSCLTVLFVSTCKLADIMCNSTGLIFYTVVGNIRKKIMPHFQDIVVVHGCCAINDWSFCTY